MSAFIDTPRLLLREISEDDYSSVGRMLKDKHVMYAWGHAFSDEQIAEWISKQKRRYSEDKCGYYLVLDKRTNEPVGQAGLLKESFGHSDYPALGYIFMQEHWGKGYALEAARACLDYAFDILGATLVIATIRPENIRSLKVAKTLGMTEIGHTTKRYNNHDMLHVILGHSCEQPRRGCANTVFEYLHDLGIPFKPINHPPAYTMSDLEGTEVYKEGAVVIKNLFLETRKGDSRYLLLVAGDKRVRTADIAAQIGSTRLGFAPLGEMYRLLGSPAGALNGLGIMFDTECEVTLLIDRQLVETDKASFHPLTNDQSVILSCHDYLSKFITSTGHTPVFVDIPAPTE